MSEWVKIDVSNLPKVFTDYYDFKSIKLGDNEKIFIRKKPKPPESK